MRRYILIEIHERGSFNVRENGRETGTLSWDEMLAQIAELTHPRLGAGRYPMQTKAAWEEEDRKRQERRANRNLALPPSV
jgi:hypothetical protein